MDGGQFGYLWFLLTNADYNRIPGSAPFIRPVDPGAFTPNQNTGPVTRAGAVAIPLTAADTATQKLAHDELKRQFNECQAVGVALRRQIT